MTGDDNVEDFKSKKWIVSHLNSFGQSLGYVGDGRNFGLGYVGDSLCCVGDSFGYAGYSLGYVGDSMYVPRT